MIEALTSILEGSSYFGLVRLVSQLSTTQVVFVFLCSKPIFIVAAFLAGFRARGLFFSTNNR